jgi:DNA repair protein RadD
MKALRDYQEHACDAYWDYIHGGGSAGLLVLATGTGKSLIQAAICRDTIMAYPGTRILCLVHTRELVRQNAQEMLRIWPGAPVGINSAGLRRRDWHSQILFASIQSVFRKPEMIGAVHLLIIDETHLVPHLNKKNSEGGMFRSFITSLLAVNPRMKILGMTATPFRLDTGRLDEGKGKIFERVLFEYGIDKGIEDGFLCPLLSKVSDTQIDTSNVKTRGGEFIQGQLEQAAMDKAVTKGAISEILEAGRSRQKWMLFCVGIEHAHAVAAELLRQNISCHVITSLTKSHDRTAWIDDFSKGRVRALVNVSVLTTGFNVPGVDLIALLRPTKSPGLAIQMIGRGTRPIYADGFGLETVEDRKLAIASSVKPNCLVLDFAGILKTHGPVDRMGVRKPDKDFEEKEGVVPVKICPNCNANIPISYATCPYCEHVFPIEPRESKIANQADKESPILSSQAIDPKWVKVSDWQFSISSKDGKPPYLRIAYRFSFTGTVNEFLCFDHGGYAAIKARRRWIELNGGRAAWVPQCTQEAFEHCDQLHRPDEIMIVREGKYWTVRLSRMLEAA